MKKFISILLSFAITVSSYYSAMGAEMPYHQLFKDAEQKNISIDAPTDALDKYKYDFKNGKELFTEEDGELIGKIYDFENPQIKEFLSKEDARAEVKWIFRLLRTQYGLYTVFGSDEVFEPAEEKILSSIEGEGTISIQNYQKAILDNLLPIIKDSHFSIGHNFYPDVMLYSNEEKEFYKKDGNFYADAECTKKVVSIMNEQPEKYIKTAIGKNGEITYYLYAMDKRQNNVPLEIYYENDKETISLKPAKYITGLNKNADVEYKVKNDIPYITANTFNYYDNSERDFKDFINTAKKIKAYPVAVYDVSANGGGNMMLPLEWFKTLTGQTAQSNYVTLRIRPQGAWRNALYKYDFEEYEQFMKDAGAKSYIDYYLTASQKQFVENNDTAIFVLTSPCTGSAAETFTDVVRNVNNVLVIGANTGGVLINAANHAYALPYSGMYFQFGECYNYFDEDYFKEGYGMEPDVYLTGDNLEERLQKFIDGYLSESKKAKE